MRIMPSLSSNQLIVMTRNTPFYYLFFLFIIKIAFVLLAFTIKQKKSKSKTYEEGKMTYEEFK